MEEQPRIQTLSPGSFSVTVTRGGRSYRLLVRSVSESLRCRTPEGPDPATLVLCFPRRRTLGVRDVEEALRQMQRAGCGYAVLADWTWEDRPEIARRRKIEQGRRDAAPAPLTPARQRDGS